MIIKPQKALNPSYRKHKPLRADVNAFIAQLKSCLEAIVLSDQNGESEEHLKEPIKKFFQNTFYQNNLINTKDRIDLAIYLDKTAKSDVGVIIEAKRPSNKAEFISAGNLNKKALQELLLYYLRERLDGKNNNIKHLIATNGFEWFLFKAEDFYNLFYKNKALIKEYEAFRDGLKDTTKNELFYNEIAKKYIEEIKDVLPYVHLDFNKTDLDQLNDNQLNTYFKIFSNVHLLGHGFGNDSNQLNKSFYNELLHIIGLEETADKGKKVIQRKDSKGRDYASLLENTIFTLEDRDYLRNVKTVENSPEKAFNVGLELCLTWINRVLFLKLLESQLATYHKGAKEYKFLNTDFIDGFDELNNLFFSALAKKVNERHPKYADKFKFIPYLNSSLFERNELESETFEISALNDDAMEVFSSTVLKDAQGKRLKGKLKTLDYLFKFLEAYDFATDGTEGITDGQETKTLINASVLGLIFEKINGYKDGSFYTPAYITMYMCKETIRRAVVQKFKENENDSIDNFEDVKAYTARYFKPADSKRFNTHINDLRICDPAVGSGHFLVSALNELISIKNELGILVDAQGIPLRVDIQIDNDELYITDAQGSLFEYNPNDAESTRVQKTLFDEKQTLIENCLFGVDINPNSVKICRLRLWIELLKNAYYTHEKQQAPTLQTLPNIDINIKCGNSLISRFDLDADLKQALKQSKWNIDSYKTAVATYRNAKSKDEKRDMETLIADIKGNFRSEIAVNDPKKLKLEKLKGELFNYTQQVGLFERSKKEQAEWNKRVNTLSADVKKLSADIEEIKSNKIYNNAFEWRFEFPEVLNDAGDFVGFDVVIGNPPYISALNMKRDDLLKAYFKFNYPLVSGTYDIYALFIEKLKNILNDNGCYSYIIPNKFLIAKYSENLLSNLINTNSISCSINLSKHNIFEEASVYPIMIFGQLNNSTNFIKYSVNNLNDFINNKTIEEDRVIKAYKTLRDSDYKIQGGLAGFQANSIKQFLTDENNENYIEFAVSGCVDRFYYNNINVRYMGNKYKTAYVNKNTNLSNEKMDFWLKPKVVIAGMTKVIEAVYAEKPLGLGVGIYGIQDINEFDGYVLTAILNSKFINNYFAEKFKDKALAGGYLAINKNTIEEIPYNEPNKEMSTKLYELSKQIHSLKKENPEADTNALEREIDLMVYALYGLTEEEIEIVEKS